MIHHIFATAPTSVTGCRPRASRCCSPAPSWSTSVVRSSALHGCIIAAAMGPKVAAVCGDRRIEGFMEVAGLAEWVLDQSDAKYYGTMSAGDAVGAGGAAAGAGAAAPVADPVNWTRTEYPIAVRGGSWDDDPDRFMPERVRSSALLPGAPFGGL